MTSRHCIALGLLFATAARGDEPPRWVYYQRNLQVADAVEQAEPILREAAKLGYNGIVLADYKLNILDRVPDHYVRNAERFKALAAELKLEIIPCVAGFGYSEGILAHDPNLAEGLPVRDQPFVVRDGVARPEGAERELLPGGTFETFRDQQAADWSYQDGPGAISFRDRAERHGGASALRFQDIGTRSEAGNARVSRPVEVRPWTMYHGSAWIKTRGYAAAANVRMFALDEKGRTLSHSNLKVQPDQDWTQHHIVFNSLDNAEVRVYCGTWGGTDGTLWLDDVSLREAGLINLVRRDACPLGVRGPDGKVYREGKDFEPVRDPKMGNVPYAGTYDVYHEPPAIRLTPGSAIRGDRVLVSYSHAVTVYDGQVVCCLADPGVFAVLEDQVKRVRELFQPRRYFLSHDEIRVANWCNACQRPGRTAGQLLAENVKQTAALVRRIDPEAGLCIWSDMFDPAHDAGEGPFYLVNGPLSGSWEGLPRDVVIVNWNSGKPAESLPFFAGRGHRQVLAGFYDGDPAAIAGWLGQGKGQKVIGSMYTTWSDNFRQLEPFAKAAWGRQ